MFSCPCTTTGQIDVDWAKCAVQDWSGIKSWMGGLSFEVQPGSAQLEKEGERENEKHGQGK